ncbi:Dak1 domain-containing protein [Leptodontidium sp. 2 PMI_412]|nr:Dak1 domain-containing protein [Leptodontidium sp. 2 PMI_412]
MPLGKHFINDVDRPVERGLECLLRLDQSLRLIKSEKVLYRQQTRPKVLLLSGGGSGHEPAHAGYLGEGMLDICVAGQIFASPSASQILAGLKALDAPMGILMIVKNYTGDKLNFGLATQKAKAEGINVNAVFVGDDVSVKGNDLVGRRGLAGVVFVHKIAGALAATGASLQEVTSLAQSVADSICTIGVSLDRCSVPQRSHQQNLPVDNLEYGMGIHNEPGVRRDVIPSLPTIVEHVLSFFSTSTFNDNIPVAVMINNLGGLSVLELNIVAGEMMDQLEAKGLKIKRSLIGTFVTSLDGPGFSVTILKLHSGFEDLLNFRTSAPAWPNLERIDQGNVNGLAERTVQTQPVGGRNELEIRIPVDTLLIQKIVKSVVENINRDEPLITKYDTIAGDGDCGTTLLTGANAIQSFSSQIKSSAIDLISTFHSISTVVESSMGGTSGALYAIFFNALANSMSSIYALHMTSISTTSPNINTSQMLGLALSQALSELCRYTAARIGHRTLMDTLIPFVETFAHSLDFNAAVGEARQGVESTRKLEAVLGRASYIGKDNLHIEEGKLNVPDPGAVGVWCVLQGIGNALD